MAEKYLSVTKDQHDEMIYHLHIENYKGYMAGKLFFATVHHDCLISFFRYGDCIKELEELKLGETWNFKLSLEVFKLKP